MTMNLKFRKNVSAKKLLGIASIAITVLAVMGVVLQEYLLFVPVAAAMVSLCLFGGSFAAIFRDRRKVEGSLPSRAVWKYRILIIILNLVSGMFLVLAFQVLTDIRMPENMALLTFFASWLLGYCYYLGMKPLVSSFLHS